MADDGTSPLEAAIAQETLDEYDAALNRLKPDEREAVVARIELGLSYAEIAEMLDKPSANAARMAVVRSYASGGRDETRAVAVKSVRFARLACFSYVSP